MPGFGDFSGFLHHLVLTKLATSRIRVISISWLSAILPYADLAAPWPPVLSLSVGRQQPDTPPRCPSMAVAGGGGSGTCASATRCWRELRSAPRRASTAPPSGDGCWSAWS